MDHCVLDFPKLTDHLQQIHFLPGLFVMFAFGLGFAFAAQPSAASSPAAQPLSSAAPMIIVCLHRCVSWSTGFQTIEKPQIYIHLRGRAGHIRESQPRCANAQALSDASAICCQSFAKVPAFRLAASLWAQRQWLFPPSFYLKHPQGAHECFRHPRLPHLPNL